MTLDEFVARSLRRARVLEALAYDEGPWAVEFNGQVVEADRFVEGSRVGVTFTVPAQCWLGERPERAIGVLLLRGEPQYVRDFVFMGDVEVTYCWALSPGLVTA